MFGAQFSTQVHAETENAVFVILMQVSMEGCRLGYLITAYWPMGREGCFGHILLRDWQRLIVTRKGPAKDLNSLLRDHATDQVADALSIIFPLSSKIP